jgi:hypothetical protein
VRVLTLILLTVFSLSCSAEDYFRMTGLSAHSTGGNNPINQGFGFEHELNNKWSVLGGVYRNSEWNYSWYTAARYAFYRNGDWNLGIGMGVVTGYQAHPVTPMAVPDFCYRYYCFLAAPKIEKTGSNVIGISVRLPIEN